MAYSRLRASQRPKGPRSLRSSSEIGAWNCPPLKCFGVATVTYGRDPDGNVFELLEMHEGSE
jgi:hypothetical protein